MKLSVFILLFVFSAFPPLVFADILRLPVDCSLQKIFHDFSDNIFHVYCSTTSGIHIYTSPEKFLDASNQLPIFTIIHDSSLSGVVQWRK
jgi:hypothetical protein